MIEAPGRAGVRAAPDALVREVIEAHYGVRRRGRRDDAARLRLRPAAVARAGATRKPPAPTRNDFQRDRDRIVHCTAFRRLVYKTQVFLNHEGDLFRTRLTHSLEVAQLGRSIARALGLNEDLVEAIALAHDLGHTPFGHAGQDALNDCLREPIRARRLRAQPAEPARGRRARGALPGLRRAEPGFETREGILKHCSRRHAEQLEQREPGGVGRRFLDGTQPSLEAQLCNLADEIAYNAHDIDDGVRSGPADARAARRRAAVRAVRDEALAEYPPPRRARGCCSSILRRMLSRQVDDVIDATRAALAAAAPASADAVRALPPLVRFSAAMRAQQRAAQALPAARSCTATRRSSRRPTARGAWCRAVRGLLRRPAELPQAVAAHAAAAPGDRRLHRRHDRPLRAARAPAADRPDAVPVSD